MGGTLETNPAKKKLKKELEPEGGEK